MDFLATLKDSLLNHLDYTLAFMAVTLLLYFYGNNLVRFLVRKVRVNRAARFLVFLALVFFGVNLLVLLAVSLIISVSGNVKWFLIAMLLIWAFIEFERDVREK